MRECRKMAMPCQTREKPRVGFGSLVLNRLQAETVPV